MDQKISRDDLALLSLLAEDRDVISYRPRLRQITGRVTAAILLQQVLYWFRKSGWRPFYKFRAPCDHRFYRSGDSWTEDLGFSPAEFDTAISAIGTKITKGVSKADALAGNEVRNLVLYWTDAGRVTWYLLNLRLLGNCIKSIYLVNTDSVISSSSETTTETTAETDLSPSVVAYGAVFPNESLAPDLAAIIADQVGSDPDDLIGWRVTLLEWKQAKWHPANITGLLDRYDIQRQAREQRQGGRSEDGGNGKAQTWEEPDIPGPTPVDPLAELWARALAILRAELLPAIYSAHFARTRLLSLSEGKAVVAAPANSVEWLQGKLGKRVLAAFAAQDDVEEVEYVVG